MSATKLIVAHILFATGVVMAQGVKVDATCTPQVSRFEARLVQKRAEGTDAFRDFLYIRRGIYAIDVSDAAERVRDIEAARASCLAGHAAAGADATTTALR